MGRGSRLKGKPNKCGILSKTNIIRAKTCHGFQTGDFVKAVVTKGKKIGTYKSADLTYKIKRSLDIMMPVILTKSIEYKVNIYRDCNANKFVIKITD